MRLTVERRRIIALLLTMAFGSRVSAQESRESAESRGAPSRLDDYDVVLNGASTSAAGAIPIGNGVAGANVWVEEGGDLCLLLSRTDAWSETCRLLKLGRLRVSFEPNPFGTSEPVIQRLRLRHGCIEIAAGGGADVLRLGIFFDPDRPVLHIDGSSGIPRRVRVSLDIWRTERRRLRGRELESSWTMRDAPPEVEAVESADLVADDETDAVLWWHRNEASVVPLTLAHQGLAKAATFVADPLLHRTFGGRISGRGLVAAGPRTLSSTAPVTTFSLRATTLSTLAPSAAAWREQLRTLDRSALSAADARRATSAWWQAFWARSWVFIEGDCAPPPPRSAHPLRIGTDQRGENVFAGEILRASIFRRALRPAEIAELAAAEGSPRPPLSADVAGTWSPGRFDPAAAPSSDIDDDLAAGFTLEALVRPDPGLGAARLIDRITPGGRDGFLLDLQPGGALRFIVGGEEILARDRLRPGLRTHIAATWDPRDGVLRLHHDGRLVAASPPVAPPGLSPVTRGYLLQRWVQACGGRGPFPIKFNGSIFTVEPSVSGGPSLDPDWRRWGDCYWWQNTRLPYHPMPASGDLEMMDPLFHLYETALPLAVARTRLWHGVEGAWFPETMTIFGTHGNGDYGWDRRGRTPDDVQCPWWRHAWNQGPELVALMLDRFDHAPDAEFLRDHVLPMADAVLRYFDTRFARNASGRLRITPTQAIETYWTGVIDDMPVVAGLHDITRRLLEIPDAAADGSRRALLERMRASLPPLPTRTVEGRPCLMPAASFDPRRSNIETPELYAVFPFRIAVPGSPLLDAAREAWNRRHDRLTDGWPQDGQFAALLGLADEAGRNVAAKARNSHRAHRFPAIWGPNYDWLPDQDHGSNLMSTVQLMLLQAQGDEIRLLPAWPAAWDVSFRLNAPKRTVVEVTWRGGKLERLDVTPARRRNDVRIPPSK